MTTRSKLATPKKRAKEFELPLLAYSKAENSAEAEAQMHLYLHEYRKGTYELFQVKFEEVVRALATIVGPVEIVQKP